MRAGTFGRTVGRAVAIALFGLTVTVAGIVGAEAAEPDDVIWDSVPAGAVAGDTSLGGAAGNAVSTASDVVWD